MRLQHKPLTHVLLAAIGSLFFIPALVVADGHDQWKFGVGTGIYALNIEGDQGINVGAFGSVEVEVDMDFDDVLDYSESGFGAAFSASKGLWRFQFTFAHLGLEGDVSGVDGTGTPISAELLFEADTLEFAANYNFLQSAQGVVGVIGGLRYYKHNFDGSVTLGATTLQRDKDFSWVDGFVGLTHACVLNKAWSWSSQADIGAGGSDFTYLINTGLNWQFSENWTTRLYGQVLSLDFEEDSKGDPGWYLYDAEEFGVGLGINYGW